MDETTAAAMEWTRPWSPAWTLPQRAPRPAPPEADLVHRASRGEATAVASLVERYQDTLYAMAMSFVRDPHRADDLAQEAWIRILQGLPTWRAEARFSSWIYRITLNTYLNSRRSAESRERREERSGLEPRSAPDRESALDVQRAVRALPDEFRSVVVLRFAADLSYREIAEVLEVPLGTVQSRLNRALDRLAQALGGPP